MDAFHKYPNKDPKTNESILIGGEKYKKLVLKYGQPKITSPKTNYKISVGKGEYNKLIAEGYTEHNLLKKEKIKSPVTKKLISTEGKTYKSLVKKGYFVSLTGNKEVDTLILLNLDMKDLNIINKWTGDILHGENFWCQWIAIHMNINTNQDCQLIAKKLNNGESLKENYRIAIEKGYYPAVKFLLYNNLVHPEYYTLDDWFTQMPLYDAAAYNHLNIVKLLLSYPIVKDDIYHLSVVLEVAAKANNLEIVQYLMGEIPYTPEDFTDALPEVVRLGNNVMIKLLIDAGAIITNTALLQSVYSDNIDTLKYLLSFPIVTIPIDVIRNTLGLRKYEQLKILLNDERTILPVKNEALYLIDDHLYNELDELLIPYLPDLAIFYEIRQKW